MIPKEKAKALIAAFCDVIPIEALISDTAEEANRKMDADFKASKQCALICVKEMLSNAGYIRGGRDAETGKTARDSYIEYWECVKKVIEQA